MEKNSGNKNIITGIVIAVIVVMIIVIVVVVAGNHATSNSGTQQQAAPMMPAVMSTTIGASPAAAASTTASYTATADNFSVDLPGTPVVDNKTFQSPTAGSIAETDYTLASSADGKGIVYMVMVFHYPATYQFSSSYLAGALKMFGTIVDAKYPGTKITAGTQSQFLGGSAISALVDVPVMGTPTPGNVLITTKNHNAYVVSAYGLSENDYQTFLNSFAFTQ